MIRATGGGRLANDQAREIDVAGKPYVVASMRADVDGDGATWARLVAFGDAAEQFAGLHKGDAVSAAGVLRVGLYTPKNGGDARLDMTLMANELLRCAGARRTGRPATTISTTSTTENRRRYRAPTTLPPLDPEGAQRRQMVPRDLYAARAPPPRRRTRSPPRPRREPQ